MTFYISVISVILSPVQCVPHPNGQETVRSALTVVCGGPAHTTMLTISAGALLVPNNPASHFLLTAFVLLVSNNPASHLLLTAILGGQPILGGQNVAFLFRFSAAETEGQARASALLGVGAEP